MTELRDRFKRSVCDCAFCLAACETMPGATAPGDVERIAEFLGRDDVDEFVVENFLASSGAVVQLDDGRRLNVPSLVPRQDEQGRCVFLQDDGHCSVHPVSPFGCAFMDMHMPPEEADPPAKALVAAQMQALGDTSSSYRKHVIALATADKVAAPLAARREGLRARTNAVRRDMLLAQNSKETQGNG